MEDLILLMLAAALWGFIGAFIGGVTAFWAAQRKKYKVLPPEQPHRADLKPEKTVPQVDQADMARQVANLWNYDGTEKGQIRKGAGGNAERL